MRFNASLGQILRTSPSVPKTQVRKMQGAVADFSPAARGFKVVRTPR
jgi:hypothetical protein